MATENYQIDDPTVPSGIAEVARIVNRYIIIDKKFDWDGEEEYIMLQHWNLLLVPFTTDDGDWEMVYRRQGGWHLELELIISEEGVKGGKQEAD